MFHTINNTSRALPKVSVNEQRCVFLVVEQRDPKQEDKFKGFGKVQFGSVHLTLCACTVSAEVIFYISFSSVVFFFFPCYCLWIFLVGC